MADPITSEDSILTLAIKDMSFSPWHADPDAVANHGGSAAQAYMAQRSLWMDRLNREEPWALSIFVENYPPRTDLGADNVAAPRPTLSPAEAVAADLLQDVELPGPGPLTRAAAARAGLPAGVAEVKSPGQPPRLEGLTPAGLPADIADYVRARAAQGVEVHVVQAPQEDLTKREQTLREANRIIHGDREKDYGAPIDSFTRLAAAFNVVLAGRLKEGDSLDPVDAANLMIAMKLSRLAGGDRKDDTFVDLAGYAALASEVRDQQ
ncbi:hypothetical protein SEA_RONA_25 [Microbacterium phage Rona]|nr:hypothetical protein SEA_RONA_25 [Microbacterium phage Rona]